VLRGDANLSSITKSCWRPDVSRRSASVCRHHVVWHTEVLPCLIRNHIGFQRVSVATLSVLLSSCFSVPSRGWSSFWLVSASRRVESLYQCCMNVWGKYVKYSKSLLAIFRQMSLRSASVFSTASYDIASIMYALFVKLSRVPKSRRRDDRRHVASVVSYAMPILVYALFGSLCRRLETDIRCEQQLTF
jgi:hypothetical protein